VWHVQVRAGRPAVAGYIVDVRGVVRGGRSLKIALANDIALQTGGVRPVIPWAGDERIATTEDVILAVNVA